MDLSITPSFSRAGRRASLNSGVRNFVRQAQQVGKAQQVFVLARFATITFAAKLHVWRRSLISAERRRRAMMLSTAHWCRAPTRTHTSTTWTVGASFR